MSWDKEPSLLMAYWALCFLVCVHRVSNQSLAPQIAKFVVVNMLAVVQTLLVSLLLARWLLPTVGMTDHVEAIAHLVGVLVPVVTSYFGHRLATFS